ncbi:TVP38/TMEM64 family protein [Paenibacillus tarimensis]
MLEWIESAISRLVEMTHLHGYYLLLVTVPLTILQGIITVFPFATLLLLHVTTFGIVQGLLISWAAGTLASVVCFVLSRTVIEAWIYKKFEDRLAKYGKWQRHMDNYGVWVVILLRSIPFVPNNIISIMAAISRIRFQAYLWSTAVGTFSQIWLFGLLGTTVIFPNLDIRKGWIAYIGFCTILFLFFLLRLKKDRRKVRPLPFQSEQECDIIGK